MIETELKTSGASVQVNNRNLSSQLNYKNESPNNNSATPTDQASLKIKGRLSERAGVKPTRKRYLILLLFCLHSMINAAQWIYLSSIASLIVNYYQVSHLAVNWTSMVYMLVYIPLVVPASWLFERIGMRASIALGSLGTTLGSLIKCFSCQPDRFYLLMTGQTLVAVSQLFVLSVPPRLASIWFPDHQVSSATACGVFANQLGIALGFVVPPMLFEAGQQQLSGLSGAFEATLSLLFVGVAAISALTSLAILLLFDSQPAMAPGHARLCQIKQEEQAAAEASLRPTGHNHQDNQLQTGQRQAYLKLLWSLFGDRNFALLMLSYGLNVGVFYAISTLLSRMVELVAPQADSNALAGRLGLVMILAGLLGSILSGYVLDRTRLYRLVNAGLYFLSLVSTVVFGLALESCKLSELALYLSVALLGYFMTGYMFIGYEMSNEITWPKPESVTAALLNLSAQVFGVVLTYFGGSIVESKGNLAANCLFSVTIFVGFIVTAMIKTKLNRQSAINT